MKAFVFGIVLVVSLLGQPILQAQDVLLRGCYGACQDSTIASNWIKKLREQAPDLAQRGFTYLWLPKYTPTEKVAFTELVKTLRKAGLEPGMEVQISKEDSVLQIPAEWLRNDFLIKSFRVRGEETPRPAVIASFLKEYYQQSSKPSLIYTDIPSLETPPQLANWFKELIRSLPEEIRKNSDVRIYDYPLRAALRRAVTDPLFDVRELYNVGLRDATSLRYADIITFINNEHFYDAKGKLGDKEDWIGTPLLAYTYLLTNNRLGLPEIFYADYYGKESGDSLYTDKQPLKKEIDQLLKVYQEFIFGATKMYYLNNLKTEKQSIYQSAVEGADASRALIFQLDGTQTNAGKAAKDARDVLVAINFADVPLKVIQEVNMSNLRMGDIFTNILGRSGEITLKVQNKEEFNIPNAVYLEVPPRSYSIWVKGEAAPVTPEAIGLAVQAFDDFVELTWETPIETDVKGYELEKSVNGSAFQKVVWIPALGEAGADYLHTDEERLPGEEISYRVKTVYKNGTTNYSSIQEIKLEVKELSFELVESAKPGVKTIKFRSNRLEEGKVTVFNADGKSVMNFNQAIKKGVSLAQIDLTTLPKGIYLLNIEAKNKVWTKKIINR